MADFLKSFNYVSDIEGYHINDKDDPGGETYRGISRVYFPSWPGWAVIDAAIAKGQPLPHKGLEPLVHSNYRMHFWDRFLGDKIEAQAVADELFEGAVLVGVHTAVIFLQESLNYLNRNESTFDDLYPDGVVGNKTLFALAFVGREGDFDVLVKMMNTCEGAYLMEKMKNNHVKEKYARGWFRKRIGLG